MLIGEPIKSEQKLFLKQFIAIINEKLQLAQQQDKEEEEVKQFQENLFSGVVDYDDTYNHLKLLASPIKILVGTVFYDSGLNFLQTQAFTENLLKSRHFDSFNILNLSFYAKSQIQSIDLLAQKGPIGHDICVNHTLQAILQQQLYQRDPLKRGHCIKDLFKQY
ncbi:hypothetical protein FGO68_gene3791 [Halteria grandinella]|uniref:Uncharacterized protein n=1 Tax=Halteria grandinella TaxID=5974 RepID=A0A8J8NYD9_HALGN|nr:hypothetical protein FGO68_gene3791 [Halteria grandinella]